MANAKSRGCVLGAVAAASYGLNPLFTLPLYGAGMGVDSVLFYRYLLAAAMLGALMLVRRQSFAVRRRDLVPLAVMGLLFSFSSLFLFESYNHMDAGIASTILFLYPVLVAVIMAVGFHEKVSRITMLSILLAFTGIAMLYKGGGEPLSFLGVALVFLSSLCYAVYIVGVNRSSLRGLPTEKLTFYALLFGLSVYVVRLRFCARPAGDSHARTLDQRRLAGALSDDRVAGDDGRRHPRHRLHAHGDPRCAGTPYGPLFRRRGLRRTAHAAHRAGRGVDFGRRDAHHRRSVAAHSFPAPAVPPGAVGWYRVGYKGMRREATSLFLCPL